MSESDNFESALRQALAESKGFENALAVVDTLVAEFGEAVGSSFPLVKIELMPYGSLTTFATMGAMWTLAKLSENSKPRTVGTEVEDRQVHKLVVAKGGTLDRILWEVKFATGTGFPVSLIGPNENEVTSCEAEGDLRSAFLKAARQGIVGRKLKAVQQAGEAAKE